MTAVAWLSRLYALALLGILVLLYTAGDRWWPATLLMFGPRWVWGLPLVVLVPAAAVARRRLLWLLLPSLAVVAGPVMGLQLPRPRPAPGPASPQALRVRVLTCNVDDRALDAAALGAVVTEAVPDVVLLQSWTSAHRARVFADAAWHFSRDGELLVASRHPIRRGEGLSEDGLGRGDGAVSRCEIEAPHGRTIVVFNLHLATPRRGLELAIARKPAAGASLRANSALRERQSDAISRWAERSPGPVVLGGDFNTPPESRLFARFWSRYLNAFSEAGQGWGYTHFTRRTAVRIDHILAGPGWRVTGCRVGPHVGSAHRPVIADLEWTGSPG